MDTRIITLDSTKVIPIPPETASEAGLKVGSRLAITVKDGGILLQPLLADDLDQLCGIFSSDVDLVAELQQERRQDKW